MRARQPRMLGIALSVGHPGCPPRRGMGRLGSILEPIRRSLLGGFRWIACRTIGQCQQSSVVPV